MIACPQCGTELENLRGMGGHARHCSITPDQMFWLKVVKAEGDQCWDWLGALQRDGYAHFTARGRKTISAHRYAYEQLVGPIPEGMDLLHSCDNRKCVNPSHTRPGTHLDNMIEMGLRRRRAVGEMCPRRKLSEAQAREILALKGNGPARKFAPQYGVGQGAIQAIWRGDAWAHLQERT